MLCQDIMRRPVECAKQGYTVQLAARKMRDANIGFLAVCDATNRVVGVITDRDIAIRSCAGPDAPASTPVEAVMTPEVVSCRPTDDVRVAEQLMARHRKSRIVVLGDNGALEGVISLSDLAIHATGEAAVALREVAAREVLDTHGTKHNLHEGRAHPASSDPPESMT